MQMRWLDLRHRVTLPRRSWQTSRLPLMTCAHGETRGRGWRRPAYDRRRLGRAGGHGFGQQDDKVKSRGTEREGMDAMQFELSNFQPLAANEAVEQEVKDLDGAEQLSAPIVESERSCFAYTLSRNDINYRNFKTRKTTCNQKGSASEERWPVIPLLQGPLRRR